MAALTWRVRMTYLQVAGRSWRSEGNEFCLCVLSPTASNEDSLPPATDVVVRSAHRGARRSRDGIGLRVQRPQLVPMSHSQASRAQRTAMTWPPGRCSIGPSEVSDTDSEPRRNGARGGSSTVARLSRGSRAIRTVGPGSDDTNGSVDAGHPSPEACQPHSSATHVGRLCSPSLSADSRPPGTPGSSSRHMGDAPCCSRRSGMAVQPTDPWQARESSC